MTSQTDLLQLLSDGPTQIGSLRVRYHDRAAPRRDQVELTPHHDHGRARITWSGGRLDTQPIQLERTVWYQAPDRLRVELAHDGTPLRQLVRAGHTWARWDKNEGHSIGVVNTRADLADVPSMLQPGLLEPIKLLSSLTLEACGAGERAGRRVVLARGRPRPTMLARDDRLHELELDTTCGIILRHRESRSGRLTMLIEATEVDFDASLDDKLFSLEDPKPAPVPR